MSTCILNLDIANSTFDGSDYNVPNTEGTQNDFISVNAEETDLIDDCPE